MMALKASLNILLAWHFEIFQTSLDTSDLTHAICLFSLSFHTLKMNKNANASFCVHLLYLIKILKSKWCVRFLITLFSLFPGFFQNCLDILDFYFLLVSLFRCWVLKSCCCYGLCLKLVKFKSEKERTFKTLLLCFWHVCQIADCVCFLCRISSLLTLQEFQVWLPEVQWIAAIPHPLPPNSAPQHLVVYSCCRRIHNQNTEQER